jgi:hypothetical protein
VTSSTESLQRWFAGAVTGKSPPEGAVESLLTPGPRMTASERLDVYRAGYVSRLVECLADDYPALKHLLGEDAFEVLATAYVHAHPSGSPSLNAFGRALPDFVRESGIDGAAFASDLARLEWALVEAVHAAPADHLSPEALAAIAPESWESARLRAAPSVRLLRFDHAVDAYLQAVRDDRPATVVRAPTATLVHRRGWVVWRRDLTPPMARLLEDLLEGATLGRALAAAVGEAGGEGAVDVTSWFQEWVAGGVFVGIETGESEPQSHGSP